MRKLICIILVIIITFAIPIYGYCDDTNKVSPQEIKLNFEDALNLLKKNNIDIQLLDKKIEITTKKFDDSVRLSEEAKGQNGYNDNTRVQYRKAEMLNWQINKLELEDLKNQRDELIKTLNHNMKLQFTNVFLLNNDIKMLNEEMKNLDKELNEAQLRIKLGQLKDTEYKVISSQKLSLQNQISELNKQKRNILTTIKKQIGINITSEIQLVEFNLPYVVFDDKDIETKITNAVDNEFALYKLREQLRHKKLEKQINVDYTTNKYSVNISAFDTAILELENKINHQVIDSSIEHWNDYYDLKILNENIQIERLNLEIEELNYNTTIAKAKLNMVDAATESSARISYNRQKNSYQRAMYNYILAAEQFNEKLGVQQ